LSEITDPQVSNRSELLIDTTRISVEMAMNNRSNIRSASIPKSLDSY